MIIADYITITVANHLKLEYISNVSRNVSTASNTNWYCSCIQCGNMYILQWRWTCIDVSNVNLKWYSDNGEGDSDTILTTVRTSPGFWLRWAFTTWNTSTTLSLLQWSMVVAMAQNIPDLLTVSLEGRRRWHESDSCSWTMVVHHLCVVAADLQWTTMGLLSVLRCTLYTLSTTVMMVCGLEHLPQEFQFSIWNWMTCWDLPDCIKVTLVTTGYCMQNQSFWTLPTIDRTLSM